MADKKDTLGGLNDAVETLNKDNAQAGVQSNEILGNIDAGIRDLYSINSQMLEMVSAIQQSLAPDAFGAAQSTETAREEGAPIVGGPSDASTVQTPPGEKKGFGMLALAGAAVAGGVAAIIAGLSGLLDFDADKIKQKVVTLLSIKDEVAGGSLLQLIGEGGAFALAMGGIGAGLAAFGIGAAVAGGGMALADWTTGGDWAQQIKDSVVVLLSIKDELGGNLDMIMSGGSFALAMAGVGAGLAAFGAGAFVAGAGLSFSDWASGGEWAGGIKDAVITLLSIKDSLGGNLDMLADGGAFMLAMTGIGAGLVAFSAGQAAAAIAQFVSDENWTETIKNNVKNLISITDEEISPEKAAVFSDTMGTMAAGLLKFSGGNFLSSLLDGAAAVVNFISGGEGPVQQMLNVAERQEDLNKGADALDRIRYALRGLGELRFDGGDLGIEDFAEDLLKAVPLIETAIMGGKIDGGILPWADDIEFKGLASGDINYEDAVRNIAALRSALGQSVGGATGEGAVVQTGAPTMTVPVPPDTGSGLSSSSSESGLPTEHKPPYSGREIARRAIALGRAMGIYRPGSYTSNGTVPVSINGQEVPHSLYTDDEIAMINAERQTRASMNNTSANLIPTRQSGQSLQSAQAEANANAGQGNGGNAIVQQNIAPNTVNNASTTNLATRTQHHKPDDLDLLGTVY